MTYSLKHLNLCKAGQTSRHVAASHSEIMTSAWCKVTGRHLPSPQRGHKEGGDTSRLFQTCQMLIVDGHVINAV